jgi:[glutamine synthetase] adenylyltransferase / [glutamine synthetase]-adenylyl-L-tyrosine phosphorylase
MAAGEIAALWERIAEFPCVGEEDGRFAEDMAAVCEACSDDDVRARLNSLFAQPAVRDLVSGLFAGSPYLKGLMLRDGDRLERLLAGSPEESFASLKLLLVSRLGAAGSISDAMHALRVFKTDVALLTGLCDLAGIWPVMQVTQVLTETADAALQGAVGFLFREAAKRGDWTGDALDGQESGYIVLAMGKYGAFELNYSSDIDLIVLFEHARAQLKDGLEAASFFVRMTRDLVRLMDERTKDGYVFRTDLRLRPDAGATQVALSTDAAAVYYESFGQNWERAALIKARAAAGDIEGGEAFLAEIAPFIWRKNLDFAAIADIHAMKRQVHAFRGFANISIPGHNIKLGPGGIREIEFFAQTQQLIAGGRQRQLRLRRTLDVLPALTKNGWIEVGTAQDLTEAYLYLRRIEHRLQMVADEQTHELPADGDRLAALARFSGFSDVDAFSKSLLLVLECVEGHYGRLFEQDPELTKTGANLVFAGKEDDPATLVTLSNMGFSRPSDVLSVIRGWHHGRYPAVRSPRARELLTDVQPLLVVALAETADPDGALVTLDKFLSELPAGVQLFSLLRAHPGLLRLIADIMGTAPRLARILSRRRRLLDAVLDPGTFAALLEASDLDAIIEGELGEVEDIQDILDRARVVGSEQAFLIGIRVLSGTINAHQAGEAYALLAERLIVALQRVVEQEMERAHGVVPGGGAAVVAMGKLGGREMTASSDIDLIVVYDFDPEALQSDGAKPLSPTQYYSRFTQRLITALSAPTPEGALYEVDMRLRPSGQKGPVATQLSGFVDYQTKEAWTWEHLALTRARVITGAPILRERVESAIRSTLVAPREQAKTAADVRDMRERIWGEKGSDNVWELKHARGGLVDLEFIAQYLQLNRAPSDPSVLDQNTITAFRLLAAKGVLSSGDAEVLLSASRLFGGLTQILRLCVDGPFEPDAAPAGLKELLVQAGHAVDFADLERNLQEIQGVIGRMFARLVA